MKKKWIEKIKCLFRNDTNKSDYEKDLIRRSKYARPWG